MPKKRWEEYTQDELNEKMRQSLKYLENHLPAGDGPRGNGLVVVLAGAFGGGGARVYYAANAVRADVIATLREMADKIERPEDMPN